MIITLSGVTGVGKSHYKSLLTKKLHLKNIMVITTRPKRKNEIHGIDKYFVSHSEFEIMKTNKAIGYFFEEFGEKYGYFSNDLISNDIGAIELYYTEIDDFKKSASNTIAIYIIPRDINIPKEKLKNRNLSKENEIYRLNEIDEQYYNFKNNPNLYNPYDLIIYNDYDSNSEEIFLEKVSSLIIERSKNG